MAVEGTPAVTSSQLSLDDLFSAGIVFDIVGAYILVSGLLLPAK